MAKKSPGRSPRCNWRETRAYPLVIRWLLLSDAVSTRLSGDVPTQDGGTILAAVCDGDLDPIRRLVLNRDAGFRGGGRSVRHAITTGMTLGVAPFSASQNWRSFTTSMLSS